MVRTVHTNHFYEILAQISDPKIEFLTKTHFLKNDHVQNFRKLAFGQKKAPAGWFHSKTKVVNTFPTVPDPIRTKLHPHIAIFIANVLEIGNFQSKSLKNLKLLRKPCYVRSGFCV